MGLVDLLRKKELLTGVAILAAIWVGMFFVDKAEHYKRKKENEALRKALTRKMEEYSTLILPLARLSLSGEDGIQSSEEKKDFLNFVGITYVPKGREDIQIQEYNPFENSVGIGTDPSPSRNVWHWDNLGKVNAELIKSYAKSHVPEKYLRP